MERRGYGSSAPGNGTAGRLPNAVAWALPLSLLALACGSTDGPPAERPAPLVEVVAARSGSLPLEEEVNGVVKARNQVAVRPELAATVAEVRVRSGATVERGEVLVRLADDEPREQLRQAEADVRLAAAAATEARARVAELEARVRRTRLLAADGLVSEQDFEVQEAQLDAQKAAAEQSDARVDQARATADQRRSALAKTIVRAPVGGRVGERRVEVGSRVDSDTVLFLVGDLSTVEVEVPLTERMLDRVEPGMPVVITSDAGGPPIRATLSRISPFLEEASFTTVGEIDIDNAAGRLRPGMFVRARILWGESRRATLVPASALWTDPESGERGVWVVAGGGGSAPADPETERAVALRPTRVLAEGRGTVGVEGVDEGELVVVVGQMLLRERARDAERRGEAATAVAARVRVAEWERIESLQALQREDLLTDFLAKQQAIAAAMGAEIPASEDDVDRALAAADGGAGPGVGGR